MSAQFHLAPTTRAGLPPRPKVELLPLLPDESFRLLRWNERDVTDLVAIGTEGKNRRLKGAGDVWHCHPGMEIVLVTQGSGTRLVGDNITGFEAPDLVLLGSNVPHCWHAPRISGYALQFDFAPDHPFWGLAETNELHALWRHAQNGVQFTGSLASRVSGLIASMPTLGGMGRLARLLTVFDELQRAATGTWRLLSQKSFPSSQDETTHRGIQKAIQQLLDSFHEDLTFQDVLQGSGLSKATFQRQFKRHTGKTFTRFLTELRIDSARRQLIETSRTIGEIAFASGFNNLSHFNHQFSLIHGENPTTFRQRAKAATASS